MITLYDADRCPYCARVRIVLAEKGNEYETVEIDLDDRPAWIYEKNPLGKVPILEEDAFVLPESAVIGEYLEERYPEPPLWPADPAERALASLDALLDAQPFLSGREYGLADIAYVPWILRARDRMGIDLAPFPALSAWVSRLEQRPAIAAELGVVASL